MSTSNIERASLVSELTEKANRAYCDYIAKAKLPASLGVDWKLENGKFGRAELAAIELGAELLGKHRAYMDVVNMLTAGENGPECSICRRRHGIEVQHAAE